MYNWTQEAVARNLPVAALFSRAPLLIGIAFVASYALVDWLSDVSVANFYGIMPWNPAIGLSFALILLLGRDYIPWLFVAPFVTNMLLVSQSVPLEVNLLGACLVGLGYGGATAILTMPQLGFDRTLSTKRSLVLLVAAAAISTAFVAVSHVVLLMTFGLVAEGEVLRTMLQWWIGDMIGITVVTPFLLLLFTRRRLLEPSWELAVLVLVLVATIAAVFGLSGTFRVKQFYLFFLPVMWTAVRFGLEGVTAGLVLTQIGLMAAMQYSGVQANELTAYQALMIVLALTGLTIGAVVNEQLRTQAQLRQNQLALERAARLDTMGAFAAVLAHEINQPLTAIANYTRLVKLAVDKESVDRFSARQSAERAVLQVDRAAEVVRRLRDFIRMGTNEMVPEACGDLIREAISHCRFDTLASRVAIEARIARNLPAVVCDSLQIQQVLINLIRNAAESIREGGRQDGRIVVEAAPVAGARVMIKVADNGPGFDRDILAHAIAPFATTKSEGLGLGLALAHSTAESHGGQLLVENTKTGAAVSFTLPTAEANT